MHEEHRLGGRERLAPVGRAVMSASPERWARAAPRSLQRTWTWLCALSLVVALTAVAFDLLARGAILSSDGVVPRLLTAGALAGLAVVLAWSGLERRGRDLPRHRLALTLFVLGNALLYGGQVLGYVFIAQDGGVFPGWVEAIPLLVAGPLLAVGMLLLTWPPGLSRAELWGVFRDTALATTGLLTIWLTLVVPVQRASPQEVGGLLSDFDAWTQFLGFVALAMVAATSRRSGSLPIVQLILLEGGVLIYLVSDILGHAIPVADRASSVTYSVIGYCVSAYVVMRFAVRPALETDPPKGARLRDAWSYVIPYLPIPLAGVALLATWAINGTVTSAALAAGVALVILAASVLLLDRLALARDRRAAHDRRMVAGLLESANSAWFAALIGDTQDLVTVVDRDGRVVYQTPSLLPVLGYEPGTFDGRPFAELAEGVKRRDLAQLLLRATLDASDRGPHDMLLVGLDGTRHFAETMVTPLTTDGGDGYVLTSRDVTDRRRLRSEFADSSLRDHLTQLANREGFLARLRAEVPAAVPGTLAVALLDLTAFRDLNDSRGHEAGDQVLRAVSESLVRLSEEVHAVARTGPDEFGLIIVADPVEQSLGAVERELDSSLSAVLLPDGRVQRVDFDFGYTVKDAVGTTSSDLIEEADLALAEARSLPTNTVVRFDPRMRSALVDRLRAEADLRDALSNGRIVTHYQPIVDLGTGRIHGVEALARMRATDQTLVPPALFIPVAESLGLIDQVGQAVLSQALRDLARLNEGRDSPMTVSVNVSADQVDDTLVAVVREALEENTIPASWLVLELTETALAESRVHAREVLDDLRNLGCAIALDDFGTGYSSMAYLADLPVDRLKIDRSFVGSLGASKKSQVLVRTLLQLSRSLGLMAVAEGVETLEQADLLRGMECQRGQGYLFGRPMSIDDLLLMLDVTGGLLPLEAG